ncbi:sphingolipid C4-monooxygenase [Ranunculus cassubicifolius]
MEFRKHSSVGGEARRANSELRKIRESVKISKPKFCGFVLGICRFLVSVFLFLLMHYSSIWKDYLVHLYMHQNKFLYCHIHSQHHRLVAPYAIGALYSHPPDGLLLDTFGGALSFLTSGMTACTAVIFFCFAVIKTVDDHCGLWLPPNIFHLLSRIIQLIMILPIWDKILGTYMPYTHVKPSEGGLEARAIKTFVS